ncbi:Leucine rich repeat containing protein 7 [Sarcoptes scabiei]|uniref:Leucine rich repeat containing protein 7 n=1 Tax=Sarcoptes scabiei TaxID=52283 RepID=A0A132A031_SARSC|nr:Leucine rich repeat containing protein 7 [Sarcoptes scabiei]
MGVFVECSSTDIKQINDTLKILNNSTDSQKIRSLSIYSLSDTGSVKQLPDFLFQTFNALSELHISKTNLSSIGTQQTYSGLENSLQSLSFVNSKISTIPKTTLNKLIKLKSFDVQSNQIDVLDSYAFYGLPLRILNLQNNLIKKIQEFAFGGLENTLEELILNGNRRLRKLSTLKMQNNQINQIPDDGFTRFTLLETLDLQSNRIRHLNSRSFLTMPKLKILYCSNNLLTVI